MTTWTDDRRRHLRVPAPHARYAAPEGGEEDRPDAIVERPFAPDRLVVVTVLGGLLAVWFVMAAAFRFLLGY
jgi:hypothetical protein